MMSDHERIDEMMAAQALAGLPAADEAELELLRTEHGRDCPDCRRLESAYGEVAGRLAFALEPEPVPEAMADEILARADEETPGGRPWRPRAGWGRRLAAVAAAAVLLVAGGVGGYLVAHPPGPASDVRAAAEFVSDPATRVAHLSGTGTGNVSIAYQPGRRTAYLIGSGVPQAPSGKVYELWRFGPSGLPVPSGTFEGSGKVVVLRVAADLSRAKQVAVTVERAPGTKHPTTKPIFAAPISV
jgi:anti-sigma-K factor RskA